jgi:hypothetical protein
MYPSGISVNPAEALRWYQAAVDLATNGEDSEDLREARTYVARAKNGQ